MELCSQYYHKEIGMTTLPRGCRLRQRGLFPENAFVINSFVPSYLLNLIILLSLQPNHSSEMEKFLMPARTRIFLSDSPSWFLIPAGFFYLLAEKKPKASFTDS